MFLHREMPASPLLDQSPTVHAEGAAEAEARCLLLETLPQHVLLELLQRLDTDSLCFLAQTCRTFLHLCSTPSQWPRRRLGGPLVRAVRYSLAAALHVPPQVFNVRVEEGRSSKFPLSVPLHNLRFVLGAADVESLAERASGVTQDLIAAAPAAATYHPASASVSAPALSAPPLLLATTTEAAAPTGVTSAVRCDTLAGTGGGGGGGGRCRLRPSAALLMCRADRGFVRLGLRPGVAVARVLLAAPAFTSLPAARPQPQAAPPPPAAAAATASAHAGDAWACPAATAAATAAVAAATAAVAEGRLAEPSESAAVEGGGGFSGGGGGGGGNVAGQCSVRRGRDGGDLTNGAWERSRLTPPLQEGVLDELLALPSVCAHLDTPRWRHRGSGSSSGDGAACGGGGHEATETSYAAAAEAAGAEAAEAAEARVADMEAAQLQLLELAAAGVPYAREAWRAFAAGCHQVAATRLRLMAAVGAASAGARVTYLQPQPQPLLAVDADAGAAEGGGGGGEGSAAQLGTIIGNGSEAATHPATATTAAAGHDHHHRHRHRHHHRHGLLGPASPPPPPPPSPQQPPLDSRSPRPPTSSFLPPPHPPATDLHPDTDPAPLYRLCVSVRLRLLGLMTLGTRSNPTAAATARPGGGGATPQPVGLATALEGSRAIALTYGRLVASVAAAREGFAGQAAPAAAVAGGVAEAAAAAAIGGGYRGPEDLEPSAAGVQQQQQQQQQAGLVGVCNSWMGAAAAALDAAAAAAGGADANLCLTTSEALLELRAEITAAMASTASTACTAYTGGKQTDGPGAAVQQLQAAAAAEGADGGGSGGDEVGRAGGGGTSAAAASAAAASEFVRRLCSLLSGCLVPAAVRLLTPARYSPFGLELTTTAGDGYSGGGGGGALGPAVGAAHLGVSLARAAAAPVDAAAAREALRGLLLSYMLRLITWTLYCLGVL